MTAKNFTTTMSPETLRWLSEFSQKTGKTRRQIIEEGLDRVRQAYQQDQVAKKYAQVTNDKEWNEIAEEGIENWPQYE